MRATMLIMGSNEVFAKKIKEATEANRAVSVQSVYIVKLKTGWFFVETLVIKNNFILQMDLLENY